MGEGLAELTGEDPEYDYNVIMQCVADDLQSVGVGTFEV